MLDCVIAPEHLKTLNFFNVQQFKMHVNSQVKATDVKPYDCDVRRSEFDEILIRNAAEKKANVIEGCQVKDVTFLPDSQGATVP